MEGEYLEMIADGEAAGRVAAFSVRYQFVGDGMNMGFRDDTPYQCF